MSKVKQRQFKTPPEVRLLLDKDTGDLYWRDGPKKDKKAGWVDNYGYLLTRYEGVLLRNHHLVWYLTYGVWPSKELDHKNGDRSDNRIDNLRESDRSGQGANQRLQNRREGCYKGVHKNPDSSRFHAKIKYLGKTYHLGSYDTQEGAAKAYDKAARHYFGKFAATNFPEGP